MTKISVNHALSVVDDQKIEGKALYTSPDTAEMEARSRWQTS